MNIKCPNCDQEIPGKECPDCGEITPVESKYCINCGTIIQQDQEEMISDDIDIDFDNRVPDCFSLNCNNCWFKNS